MSIAVLVSKAIARKYRLKSRTIATGAATAGEAVTLAVNVRFTAAAKRRLRGARTVPVSVLVTLKAPGSSSTTAGKSVLKR